MGRLRKAVIAAAMAALLITPASAFAGSPAQDAYDIPGGQIEEELTTPPSNPPGDPPSNERGSHDPASEQVSEAQGGSLPFTGLDLGLMVGAGGVLLALGLGMRRLSRVSEPA